MEIDLKKVFYIIVCLVLLGVIASAMATPIKNKISAQQSQINSLTFT